MKIFVKILTLVLLFALQMNAQENIQGTVEKVGNLARVSAQAANTPLVNAEITNMNVLLSIEDVFGPVVATVDQNYITNLSWTLTPSFTAGGRLYFLFIGTDNGTAPQNWPLLTPQKIIDVSFTGANASPYEDQIRLSDLDGDNPPIPSNNIWYVEVNSFDQTNYTERFYQTVNTTPVANGPTEWWVETLGLVPLPVELLAINSRWSDDQKDAVVQWTTASERDLARFDVERAPGEKLEFTKVGEVKAAGNSSVKKSYTFTDKSTSGDRSDQFYYRLKMVDKNGAYNYSPVVNLNRQETYNFQVTPNPNNGLFFLNVTSAFQDLEDPSYVITDVVGKMIKNGPITDAKMQFDMSKSVKGVYFLSILSAGKEVKQYKVIKGEDK